MKPALLLGLACLSVAASQPLQAQLAPGIPIVAQSLVHQRDGAVQGCGVRLTGGEAGTTASAWFDVSFNIFRRGVALAQSIAYEIRRLGYAGENRPSRVSLQSTWIKAADGNAKLGENSDRRETLVYSLQFDDALSLFQALGSGRAVSVGIKRWGQAADTVYTGIPVLTSETREEIGACLERLAQQG
jgi:hypothetical protein